MGPRVAAGCLMGVTRGARSSPWGHAEGVGAARLRPGMPSAPMGVHLGGTQEQHGGGRRGGDSLIWEELQGPAARRALAHAVVAALAEAGCGGRLVMDVHRGVRPLGWRRAGRGAEEAAEAVGEAQE